LEPKEGGVTVAELIAHLTALPDHSARVVVDGYDGGFSDMTDISQIDVAIDVSRGVLGYGPHDTGPWWSAVTGQELFLQTASAIRLSSG